jgi:hypothetical protein
MAYGRLDVFWPDGKIETYTLNEDNVSIGRSTGNTIVLDTDTISRYHVNIGRDNSQVFLRDLDSANGTFVDGVRLENNERLPLNGGEEIQIGYLRLIYYQLDDTPTMQLSAALEDTQKVERESPDFRLELQPPPIAIAPGSYTSAELVVYNTGNTPQTYNIQVVGLPDGWARINRPMVEVEPGENTTVLINIKPFRRSDSAPGVYNAQMVVRPQDKPDTRLEVPFKVTILAYNGFGMALAARRIGSRDPFFLHIHNQGSAPLPLQITGRDTLGQMHFVINPANVTLAPGQRMQIIGEVRPSQRRLFGSAREYPFDLVVQSLDNARFTTAVRGYLLDKPPMPFWMMFVMGGVFLLALGLMLAGVLALLGRSPDPIIERFTIDNPTTQLVQGDPLLLSWQVRDAERVSIHLNDRAQIENEDASEVSSAALDTAGLSGDVTVLLIASNNDKSTTATQRVTIFPPMTITEFSIEPASVVRNVVQTITISYDVPGALGISIKGLQGVALSPVPIPNSDSGSIEVAILPVSDFSVQLDATGEFGKSAQQTLNISLVDPVCTATTNMTLYAQPSTAANVVSTVTQGSTLVVSGRDPSGGWIRVVQPGLNLDLWGQRQNFTCVNTFNVEDLRQVVVDNLPVITATVAPPLTVVPTTRTITPTPQRTPTIPGTPASLLTPFATQSGATPTVNTTGN